MKKNQRKENKLRGIKEDLQSSFGQIGESVTSTSRAQAKVVLFWWKQM